MPNVVAYLGGWGASPRKVISTLTVRVCWPWRRYVWFLAWCFNSAVAQIGDRGCAPKEKITKPRPDWFRGPIPAWCQLELMLPAQGQPVGEWKRSGSSARLAVQEASEPTGSMRQELSEEVRSLGFDMKRVIVRDLGLSPPGLLNLGLLTGLPRAQWLQSSSLPPTLLCHEKLLLFQGLPVAWKCLFLLIQQQIASGGSGCFLPLIPECWSNTRLQTGPV